MIEYQHLYLYTYVPYISAEKSFRPRVGKEGIDESRLGRKRLLWPAVYGYKASSSRCFLLILRKMMIFKCRQFLIHKIVAAVNEIDFHQHFCFMQTKFC